MLFIQFAQQCSPLIAIEKDDPYIEIAEKGMDSLVTSLDFYLVNLIPMLRYLPKWFPGAQFLGIAKEGYKNGMNMYRKPHEMTKKKVVSTTLQRISNYICINDVPCIQLDGTAFPSITSKLIEDNRSEKGEILNEELIAKVTGITYGGKEHYRSVRFINMILINGLL